VYLGHNGPEDFAARLWAALLHAGADALADRRTAGFLQGLVDDEPRRIEIVVPAMHHVSAPPGVHLRRSRLHGQLRHPAAAIPQVRLEHTVVELASTERAPDDVVSWLTRACGRRLTTPARLREALALRSRVRHRGLIQEALADITSGAVSPLERRYLRDVERRHGLPTATRQRRHDVDGTHQYSDVEYERYRVRVELDGLAYHPAHLAERDARRDNAALLVGDLTLRFSWGAVAGDACGVAVDVACLLRGRGWPGTPRPCSPTCPVPSTWWARIAGDAQPPR
jgi:very-short-patch-repair endonuclease